MVKAVKADLEKRSLMQKKDEMLNIHLDVEKYQLPNGLKVLLHLDRRIPQIYHLLLVKAGSKDEVEGKTGLAHLFEHMMFRGTEQYSGEEYEQKLESIGAKNNAFTSRDYTGYEVTLPSGHLEMILKMEAERMHSLQLTQSNLDKEKEVVKEERRLRTDNNPNEIFEPIMRLVFPAHPYGRPVIGWMQDLEDMNLEDCKDFYSKYYAPNNSVLILAGRFDKEKTKKWIAQYYGALKPSELKRPAMPQKQIQKEIQKKVLNRPVEAPTLAFAYRGPKAGHEGAYSLEVLNRILTHGESSRLHKLLVYEKKLALSAGGFYYAMESEGVFLMMVKMAPGADLEKVKQIVYQEIDKVRKTNVGEQELLKSRRAIMYDYVSAVKDISGKAGALGASEMHFGDYKQFFKDLNIYREVSVESVKTHAETWLFPENSSIVELMPLKKSI